MKKALIVVQADTRKGGAEEISYQVCKELYSQGYLMDVCFLLNQKMGDWDDIKQRGITFHYTKASNTLGQFVQLIQNCISLRKNKYTLAFCSLSRLILIVGLLRRLKVLNIEKFVGRESTNVFLRFRGVKLTYKKIIYKIGYPALDTLVCQTSLMKQQLIENIPWLSKSANVIVVHNPFNNSTREMMKDSMADIQVPKPYIVTAGRFIPEKGYDILIAAFKRLRDDFPNLNLLILGDGKLRCEIQSQINALELGQNVILAGRVNNVYPYFRDAEMCVVSSRQEGFPNVLLQMMSQNKRVVSTLCAGDIDCIEGLFLCKPCDEDALLHALRTCLECECTECKVKFEKELEKRNIQSFVNKVFF